MNHSPFVSSDEMPNLAAFSLESWERESNPFPRFSPPFPGLPEAKEKE
jgi:hypothetical protein